MFNEYDVVIPVLKTLATAPNGKLQTREVRERVRKTLALTAADLKPLVNRSDQRIDQIIRNLKSHRNTPGNPFCDGLMVSVHRGYAITALGRARIGDTK